MSDDQDGNGRPEKPDDAPDGYEMVALSDDSKEDDSKEDDSN